MGTTTQRLLSRVRLRQRVALLGRRFYVSFLALAGAYGGLLLCSRLLAIIPNWFVPANLVTISAAALALALALCRRPRPAEVARLVDERVQTDDLFLNAVLIDTSAGQYQPLVLRAAERRAATIRPKQVVPARGAVEARNTFLAVGVLLVGILFLPQLDPFGREQERQRVLDRRRKLDDGRKAAALRLATLREKTDAELSREVKLAVDELKQTFNSMKKADKPVDLRRLKENQARLGELWRKAGDKKLKSSFRQGADTQRFGQGQGRRTDQWRQDLQQAKTGSMQKQVAALKEKARRLAETADEIEKRKLADELKRDLAQMQDFVANELNAKPLDAALERAMAQLAMAGMGDLSSAALEALQESLDLTELELESLAQDLRDLEALEDALKALQLAKMASDLELLDPAQCALCESMADYEALYRKLMAGRCLGCGACLGPGGVCPSCGIGLGMRGPGIGVGNVAPEVADAVTDFKSEKSRSALQAGKILLSLKTRGLSEPGQAVIEYRQQIGEVKQGVGEAIIHEQIPPAYHEAIQRYFDSMEQSYAGTEGE